METKRKRRCFGISWSPASRFHRVEEEDHETASLAHLVIARARLSLPASLHVAPLIYSFLDCSRKWTLEQASAAGLVLLLDRLAADEPRSLDYGFRQARLFFNVEAAARNGHVDVLDWWRTRYLPFDPPEVASEIFRIAAWEGHLHVLQWLCETEQAMEEVGSWDAPLHVSHQEILTFVHKKWKSARMAVHLDEAASRGDLTFIRWVRSKTTYECCVSENTILAAAQAGHIDILQYFFMLYPATTNTENVYIRAVEYGQLHVVKWLLREDENLEAQLHLEDDMVVDECFPIIEWLAADYSWRDRFIKAMWFQGSMRTAACNGNLKIFQCLYEHGTSTNNLDTLDDELHVLDLAISSGNLDLVKWLYVRGIGAGDEDFLSTAVISEQLQMVQWVHDTYSALVTTPGTMDRAACHSLEIVRFLHVNRSEGCTSNAMDNAAFYGKFDIVRFLHEYRSEGCSSRAMIMAAGRGHVDIVKFLHETRSAAIPTEAINLAAQSGHLEVIKYLHQFQSEAPTHLCEVAASNGHLSLVQWLYENRPSEFSVSRAMQGSATNGHIDVVCYLAQHGKANFNESHVEQALQLGRFHLALWMLQVGVSSRDNWYEDFKFNLGDVYNNMAVGWHARMQKYGHRDNEE